MTVSPSLCPFLFVNARAAPLDLCECDLVYHTELPSSPLNPPNPTTPFPLLATGHARPGLTSLGRYSRANTSTFTPEADVSSALAHITVPLKVVMGDITLRRDSFK